MNNLTIINQNGILLVDSREVAERTGKEHTNLLRDINNYIEVLENSKLSSQNFFVKDTYKVKGNNKTYPCYLLTRKGCDMVANKMTGEKGILFTAEYVTEFEKMEQAFKAPAPKLSKEIQAIFILDERTERIENEVKNIKENSPLFSIECDELQKALKKKGTQILGGKQSKAYKDSSLRGKLYSDIQREIKRQFGLESSYKALKRKELNRALDIIKKYSAPLVILDQIAALNNQVEFERVI